MSCKFKYKDQIYKISADTLEFHIHHYMSQYRGKTVSINTKILDVKYSAFLIKVNDGFLYIGTHCFNDFD